VQKKIMNRVIKMSKAGIAALVFSVALAGCGGGSSGGSSSTSSGSGSLTQSQNSSSETTALRTAALSWNAPLQRQNNVSLSMGELSGYVISYGQDPEDLDQTIRIDDASDMDYTVEGLEDGTWYFSVQVEDTNGLMSPPSDLVSKTIQS